MEMLKPAVIHTFSNRNNISLNSNKLTKDTKTCKVGNGESEQYETLLELFSNSDELCQSMKTGKLNIVSGTTLKNVVCFDNITQEKKIVQFVCGVSDVHVNKRTATDLQKISSTVEEINNEGTVAEGIISKLTGATGFINEIYDFTGCISETTQDTGSSSESIQDTGVSSETAHDTGFSSESIQDTGVSSETAHDTGSSSESIQDTGVSSETAHDTGFSSEVSNSIEFRSETTDAMGFIIEKIEEIGLSCKTTTTSTSRINSPLTKSSTISEGCRTTIKIPELKCGISELIEDSDVNKFRNEAVEIKEIRKGMIQLNEINQETSFSSCVSGIDTCHSQISSEDSSILEVTVKDEKKAKGIFAGEVYSSHIVETHSNSKTTNEPTFISEEQSLHFEEKSRNDEALNSSKQLYDIEKFLDAVILTNKDMVKKSGILLQKQNLISEVLSYVHAIQSVLRLSKLRRTLPKDMANGNKDKVAMSSNIQFYEAGETILEELKLYQGELKSDFRDWETFRLEILQITERIPYEFELCDNEATARMLMHEITTEICTILKNMEIITSKREERNEECIDLMDGIDTYVRYSSAFIMEKNYLNLY